MDLNDSQNYNDSSFVTTPRQDTFSFPVEDDSSKGYIAWRRRRVNFDPKVSATMPRPTPAMMTPCERFQSTSTQSTAERDFQRLKKTAKATGTAEFLTSQISGGLFDDSQYIPHWLRDDYAGSKDRDGCRRSSSASTVASTTLTSKTNRTTTGAASSYLPATDDGDMNQASSVAKTVLSLDELLNSPMAFTQRLLDLHDELKDVEESCQVLVRKALRLDPKTSVTEILEGSSELSYHSIKVDAVDGEIRRIQREITGTFSVMNGTIIAGSENLPAEKSIALLNSLRACIPEVRSAIRLADTRLTSLLM